MARGDVETYEGRIVKPEDNGFVSPEKLTPEFPLRHAPLRAKSSKAVTQLAYAAPASSRRRWSSSPSAKISAAR